MIELNELVKSLQNKLNATAGFNFYITADTADLKLPKMEDNEVIEYINGVLQGLSSEVTNLVAGNDKSLLYATQTCNLRLIVPIQNEEFDTFILKDGSVIDYPTDEIINKDDIAEYVQGYRTKLENVRSVLSGVFQGVSVEDMHDKDGNVYSVTTVYALEEGQERAQLPMIGDSYSFYVTIYYSFIQNGISTKWTTFKLDGAIIPYQNVTVFRAPTMDGNVYANTKDGVIRNIASQSGFSMSFELPAFKEDRTTENIIDYILNGELNQAHLLTFAINGKTKTYLVTYGENRLMGETIKNVGQSLTLVECPDVYDLISFSNNYHIYESTSKDYAYTVPDNAQFYAFMNFTEKSVGDILVATMELDNVSGLEKL